MEFPASALDLIRFPHLLASESEPMARVFVNAAAADEEFASRLSDHLRREDVECLVGQPSGSKGTAQDGEAAAIENADALILVLTPEYLSSSSEAEQKSVQTVAGAGKTVIALLRRECQLPPQLQELEPFDVAGESGVEKACLHVLEVLTALPGSDPIEEKAEAAVLDSPEPVQTAAQPSQPPKSLLDRWQTWLTLAVTVVVLLAFGLDLPAKLSSFWNSLPTVGGSQPLAGVVWDEQHEPLAGVTVVLPEFDLEDTTEEGGRFSFEVPESHNRPVNLIARKEGYVTQQEDPVLPNSSFSFVMRKKTL